MVFRRDHTAEERNLAPPHRLDRRSRPVILRVKVAQSWRERFTGYGKRLERDQPILCRRFHTDPLLAQKMRTTKISYNPLI